MNLPSFDIGIDITSFRLVRYESENDRWRQEREQFERADEQHIKHNARAVTQTLHDYQVPDFDSKITTCCFFIFDSCFTSDVFLNFGSEFSYLLANRFSNVRHLAIQCRFDW